MAWRMYVFLVMFIPISRQKLTKNNRVTTNITYHNYYHPEDANHQYHTGGGDKHFLGIVCSNV